MKSLLYIIAVLLVIIWGIIVIGFKTSASAHLILLLAGIIILIRFLLDKKELHK